jgi:hypothetical protein
MRTDAIKIRISSADFRMERALTSIFRNSAELPLEDWHHVRSKAEGSKEKPTQAFERGFQLVSVGVFFSREKVSLDSFVEKKSQINAN